MKRTIMILLGGLLVASPAYADETDGNFDNIFDNNDGNLNNQGDPNNQVDPNNEEGQDNQNDFNQNDTYNPEQSEDGLNEEENYEEPPVEEHYEPPVEENYEPPVEETPEVEAPAEEESSSIVTKVKQDSYSISGTVFLNDKKVPAKLEVGDKTFETKQPGEFKIEGLQPGKHTIKVVEADGKSVGKTVDVEITDKDKINVDIKISDDESEDEETIQKDDPEVKETSKALIFSVVGVIILTIIGVIALILRNRK
ncbi:MAG TPA: hypothetical protein H9767_02155 [Candidatus Nosocomiicoccus stercorigallinarum]|nr:hypothetical protein [Candidatus Nosocomiicoccus stercorigallinarum]